VDPSGHDFWDYGKDFIAGAVGAAVFVLTGGTATPCLATLYASIYGGMAAGAVSGALNGGGIEGTLLGAAMGGAMGGAAGGLYLAGVPGTALLAISAGATTATGGLEGLGHFAAGFAGALVGGAAIQAYIDPGTESTLTAADQTQSTVSDAQKVTGLKQKSWFNSFGDNIKNSIRRLWPGDPTPGKPGYSNVNGMLGKGVIAGGGAVEDSAGRRFIELCVGIGITGVSWTGGPSSPTPGAYVSFQGGVIIGGQVGYTFFSAQPGNTGGWWELGYTTPGFSGTVCVLW